mmetsp:Transcript_5002/g.18719  ORF Transcript_5002/g.18719 Transcript_5002/m.18719 type:complete len:224 (+) Transcript_5002:1670-2341(+)
MPPWTLPCTPPTPLEESGTASCRQIGHCEMRYSPGWCAMGPRTKHFQQKRWLHANSTMSEMVSKQIGHCCVSFSRWFCWEVWVCPGASSESTSTWPKDSMAACSSAKSEPLKKLCRESQPARSAAMFSIPRFVCLRRFLRILTTATAFHTAYLRSWSTSRRMHTKALKVSGRCRKRKGANAEAAAASLPAEPPACASSRLELLCPGWKFNSSARVAVRDKRSC